MIVIFCKQKMTGGCALVLRKSDRRFVWPVKRTSAVLLWIWMPEDNGFSVLGDIASELNMLCAWWKKDVGRVSNGF